MILVLYTFITWWWFLFLYFMYEFYVTSCRGTGTWMYTTLIIIWHECDMYTYIWVCTFQGYTACELISRILQGCEGSDFNLINLIWFYTCTNVMGVLIETQDPIFRCLMQFECIGSHIFSVIPDCFRCFSQMLMCMYNLFQWFFLQAWFYFVWTGGLLLNAPCISEFYYSPYMATPPVMGVLIETVISHCIS